jgi:hypothetical protein
MNIRTHAPLVAAIALPLIFIGVLAIAILIPTLSIKPTHDFVYTLNSSQQFYDYTNGPVYYKNTYDIVEGKIILKPAPALIPTPDMKFQPVKTVDAPPLYLYDIQNQNSHEITLAEAQKLTLQKGPASPDGYTVTFDMNHGGVLELFGSQESTGYMIGNAKASKPLFGIGTGENYYSNELNLIGWVN